jgi:hypothetical protein
VSVLFGDFASHADGLSKGSSEIDWRMSSGRAYYAAFHRARLSLQFCPDNAEYAMGSHARVTERLKLEGSMKARSIAYVLVGMKKLRVIADYETHNQFEHSLAMNQLATMKAVIAKLDDFDQVALAKTA